MAGRKKNHIILFLVFLEWAGNMEKVSGAARGAAGQRVLT